MLLYITKYIVLYDTIIYIIIFYVYVFKKYFPVTSTGMSAP